MLAQVNDHDPISLVIDGPVDLFGKTDSVSARQYAQEHTVLNRRAMRTRDTVHGPQALCIGDVIRKQVSATHAISS